MKDKDLNQLRKLAEAQGWRVVRTHNDHYKWYAPDGKTMVVSGSTPSDHRAFKNQLALMRRAGFHE